MKRIRVHMEPPHSPPNKHVDYNFVKVRVGVRGCGGRDVPQEQADFRAQVPGHRVWDRLHRAASGCVGRLSGGGKTINRFSVRVFVYFLLFCNRFFCFVLKTN